MPQATFAENISITKRKKKNTSAWIGGNGSLPSNQDFRDDIAKLVSRSGHINVTLSCKLHQ